MKAARVVDAVHGSRELARYESGEERIEDTRDGTCSEWLYYADTDRIADNPSIMAGWPLDNELDHAGRVEVGK